MDNYVHKFIFGDNQDTQNDSFITEKRHARVGEFILITKKCDHRYENGDIFHVYDLSPNGVDADNAMHFSCYIYHSEYEVILNKKDW